MEPADPYAAVVSTYELAKISNLLTDRSTDQLTNPYRDVKKDGPGPVMVSDTLCPAVHILGTYNVHSRAKGTADHSLLWAIFFLY